jgi:hypothetical protein
MKIIVINPVAAELWDLKDADNMAFQDKSRHRTEKLHPEGLG